MRNILSILTIIILGLFFHALTLRGAPGNPDVQAVQQLTHAGSPFESSHERSPYALLISLAENNSFVLSPDWAEVASPDVGYHNGKFYSFFPPGVPQLIKPFYLIGKSYGYGQIAAYATMPLFTIAGMVLLFFIAGQIFKMPYWASLLAPLIYAFSSPAWSYSITIYQHPITVFLMLSGFYAAYKYSQHSKHRTSRFSFLYAIWVWFSYALGSIVDYPNVLLLAPNIIYLTLAAWKVKPSRTQIKFNLRTSLLTTSLIFLFFSGAHAYFNYANYGHWRTLSNTLVRYEGMEKSADVLTITPEQQTAKLAKKQSTRSIFKQENLINGVNTLFLAPDKGLFIFAPIFLLAIAGIWLISSQGINLPTGILLSLVAANIFVYASFGDPWGGWAYGPRYLIPSMAILSLFVSKWVAYNRKKILTTILAFLLIIYSSALALLGVLTTNIVPPKIEADYLGMKYGYHLSLEFFNKGQTSNFIFNQWLADKYTLSEYYIALFYLIISMVALTLFVLPLYGKKNSH